MRVTRLLRRIGGLFVLSVFASMSSACGSGNDAKSGSTPSGEASAPDIHGAPFRVASGSTEWVFTQGEVTGRGSDNENSITVALYAVPFDRCYVPQSDSALGAPSIRITIEARLGEQSLDPFNIDTTLAVPFADGTVTIDAIGPTGLSGKLSLRDFQNAVWSGAFNADGCGWLGQDLFSGVECDPGDLSGDTAFGHFALSGDGRIASFAPPNYYADVAFYRLVGSGSGCALARDSTYGTDGKITFPGDVSAVAFDHRNRAYVTTGPDEFGGAGSFYRLTAGGMESCHYFETATEGDAVLGAPSSLFVLPDGSAAFLYWEGVGEWRLDLGDTPLGANGKPCAFIPRYDDLQGYTGALAAADEGLLFTRDISGRTRAVVTDWQLHDVLRFGGTPSGFGLQGLAMQSAAARCPQGWCFLEGGELRVFGLDGTFRGLVRLDTTPEIGVAPVLIAGSPDGLDVFGAGDVVNQQMTWRVFRLTAR